MTAITLRHPSGVGKRLAAPFRHVDSSPHVNAESRLFPKDQHRAQRAAARGAQPSSVRAQPVRGLVGSHSIVAAPTVSSVQAQPGTSAS